MTEKGKKNSQFVSVHGHLNLNGAAKKKINLLLNNERETMLHSLSLEVISAPVLKKTTSPWPSDTRSRPPLPSEARKRPRTTPLCLKGSLHTSRHPPQGHSLHCKHTLGAAIQWTWSTTLGRLVHVACCLTEREADVLDRALENRQLHGGQSAGVDVLCV